MKKIYLASPWFNDEQEERQERIYQLLLSLGFEVFNPKLESLIDLTSSQDHMSQTLIGNLRGIEDADLVVALVNKPYDSGTVWEAGYAHGRTPVVYYVENLNGAPFNLMLAKTGKFAGNEQDLTNTLLYEDDTFVLKEMYDFDGAVE